MQPEPTPAKAAISPPREKLEWVLAFALVAAFMSLRFIRRDLIAFMLDEPQFLASARTELMTHTLALSSPFIGSQGIHYGAGFVWFESVLVFFFGPRPETAGVGVALFITASNLALAFGLARVFRGGPWLFALLGGLLASAPFQYYWARLVWDVTFSAAIAGFAVTCLCTRGSLGYLRSALLGVCTGWSVSTHPLGTALVVGSAVVLALEIRHEGRRKGLLQLVAFAVPLVVICIPYVYFFLHAPGAPKVRTPTPWTNLLWALLEPGRVLGTRGIVYWFDDAWQDFLGFLGPLSQGLDAFAWFSNALLFIASVLGPILAFRIPERGPRRLAVLSFVLIPVHLTIFMVRQLDRVHPHYQITTYWLPLLGVAALAYRLRNTSAAAARPVRIGLASVLALVIALQVAFTTEWLRYEILRDGTLTHIPIAEQRKLVEKACASPSATIGIIRHARLYPQAIGYLAWTDPACEGKRVGFVPDGFTQPGATVVEARYKNALGGALADP